MYMRYVLYFLTLGLMFTAGMLTGNFYIPARNSSQAAAVSVPDLDRLNPALDMATPQQAQRNITALTQALSSCPVVVETERDRLFKELSLFLALQDFELKKAAYAAEIAKNAGGMSPTGQYKAAAEAYTAAKTYTEQLADQLFPPAPAEETQASSGTVTAVSTTTISQNTETASSSQPVNKK